MTRTTTTVNQFIVRFLDDPGPIQITLFSDRYNAGQSVRCGAWCVQVHRNSSFVRSLQRNVDEPRGTSSSPAAPEPSANRIHRPAGPSLRIAFVFPFFCCRSLTSPNPVGCDARWCTPLHCLPFVPQQRVDSFPRQFIGFHRLPSNVLNHSHKKHLRVPVFGVLFAALFFTPLLHASARRPLRFYLVSQEH